MLETVKILKGRFFKDNTSSLRIQRNRVRSSIELMLGEQLTHSGDCLTFEVRPQELNDAIAVIDKPPLSDKYYIVQSAESVSLFTATLKEVSVW